MNLDELLESIPSDWGFKTIEELKVTKKKKKVKWKKWPFIGNGEDESDKTVEDLRKELLA